MKIINGKEYEIRHTKNSNGKWEYFYNFNCICGNIVWVPKREIDGRGNGTKQRKFCSKQCLAKKPPKIKVKCASCNQSTFKLPSRIKLSKSGLFFCSRICKDKETRIGGLIAPAHYGIAKPKRYEKLNKNNYKKLWRQGLRPNNCKVCSIPVINEFCSSKCNSKYKAQQYIERWLNNKENGIKIGGLRHNVSYYIKNYLRAMAGQTN